MEMWRKAGDPVREAAVGRAAELLVKGLTPGKAARAAGLAKSVVQRLLVYLKKQSEQAGRLARLSPTLVLLHAAEFARRRGRPSRSKQIPRAPASSQAVDRWLQKPLLVGRTLKSSLTSSAASRNTPVGRKPYAVRLVRVTVVKRKHQAGAFSARVWSDTYLLASSPAGRRGLLYRFSGEPDASSLLRALHTLREVVGDGLRIFHAPNRLFRSRRLTSALGRKNVVPLLGWTDDMLSASGLTASRLRLSRRPGVNPKTGQ